MYGGAYPLTAVPGIVPAEMKLSALGFVNCAVDNLSFILSNEPEYEMFHIITEHGFLSKRIVYKYTKFQFHRQQ